jgi:hypothetical protein
MENEMNNNEAQVAKFVEKQGFHIINRGWPDFLCVKREWVQSEYGQNPKGVMCVEVKAGKDTLSKEQTIVHGILKGVGIPVYTIRPEEVLVKRKNLQHKKFLTSDDFNKAKSELSSLRTRMTQLERFIDETSAFFEEADEQTYKACELVVDYFQKLK